ncbi:MAG TPA: hypothetical protein VFF13_06010 [archaeon]|nr:hypothetical protein [archaeon]
MAYKVFLAPVFKSKLQGADKDFKDWFDGILDQLTENPFVGKPLSAKWFREKKHKKQRVYYLIYEQLKAVYVVNMSEKKDQQAIINSIKLLLDLYKEEIENIAKELSEP